MTETLSQAQELIWRPDDSSRWKLFNNNQNNLPSRLTDEALIKSKEKLKHPSPFYLHKERKETKGSLVYTKKGYGIIQNIKPNNLVSVRVAGVTEDFDREDVLNEIPISLSFFTKGTRRDEIAIFSIQSTAEEIYKKIEENESQERSVSCQVIWKGKELPRSHENLEKLGFTPLSKLLVTTTLGKCYSVNRFDSKCDGWGYSSTSVDGISFTVDKDVRVAGFGIYLPTSEIIAGTAKFCEGEDCKSGELFSQEISLTESMAEEPESKIWPFKFNKPIKCKAGQKYTCVVSLKSGTTFYGSTAKTNITGEKNVIFTFSDSTSSENGTSTSSGQVPTIYYYA